MLELSKDEVTKFILALKHNEYWRKILKRIAESDEDTYVGSGRCKFPVSCNQWFGCNKKHCNADVCNNGYAYRMS